MQVLLLLFIAHILDFYTSKHTTGMPILQLLSFEMARNLPDWSIVRMEQSYLKIEHYGAVLVIYPLTISLKKDSILA